MEEVKTLCEMVMKLTPNRNDYFETESTALAIFPGGGNKSVSDPRIAEVNWRRFSNRQVWVAGTRGDPPYEEEEIRRLLGRNGRLPFLLEIQEEAGNTLDQMHWVAELLRRQRRVSTLILSTAEYHLPRCTLTFVRTWMNVGDERKIHIVVLPTSNPTQSALEKSTAGTSTTTEEEQIKIAFYQKKGHVATLKDLRYFLAFNR